MRKQTFPTLDSESEKLKILFYQMPSKNLDN